MISISLCMIVKDESATLARCLDSVKSLVDELIIVDTGSTDGTQSIAAKYTDQIYTFEWINDFAAARNYAFSLATQDYIMWLDADDIIHESDAYLFKELKATLDPSIDVVIMRYHLTTSPTHTYDYSFYRERLVKRSCKFQWVEPVHEYIHYSGKSVKFDIAITHCKLAQPTSRNLDILTTYLQQGHPLTPRNEYYYARELFAQGYLEEAATHYENFLQSSDLIECSYLDACKDLSKYYQTIGAPAKSLQSLLRFFEKGTPRPEICCALGYYYKNLKDYDKAILWFCLAPHAKVTSSTGYNMSHYKHYVPYIELSICYYHKGNIFEAMRYNEQAAQAYPDDQTIVKNRAFFAHELNTSIR